jgi:cobalt-zinc-cadmium efflux system membrane fusion protein
LTIADLSTVWITADVYEENVPLLRSLSDKTLTIRNEAWPDRTFDAKVFYTGEIMDEATRTIAMRATADNSERLLKPGMFVTVDLPGITESNVFTLPVGAVLEHEGKSFVFIHKGGDSFERRNVKLGPTDGKIVVIRSGLTSGESVVVDGGFILKSRLLAELMGEE